MTNRTFGNRYQVTEKIGMGGMAEVFKATDSTLGRTVAVKVMLPQYAADANFAARFRQEAQAAANLSSPYIVNIYDWGKDRDSYYIVMEYVRGTDLKTAIQQRGKIHPRKVAEIGSQVCSALSVAHGYDIIHRDIKSANIMVQADGNVKVMDFGIAQAGRPGMTTDSSVLGTAHYVSPEQAQGKKLTPASDLYSLGVVMYEAATGQLPFDGPDVVSVAMKQVNEAPVPPRQINPDIDPQLERIIMRALEKNPEQRYATANEMKRAIDDYLHGRVSPAAAAAAAAPTQVLNGAAPYPAAGATTVMNPSNGVRTAGMPATQGKNAAGKPGKKGHRGLIALVVIVLLVAAGIGIAFASGAFSSHVTVPDVTGKTLAEATSTLEKSNLQQGNLRYETSDSVEKDHVISQDPAGNSSASSGSKVNLVISTGKTSENLVSVPNLMGLTPSEAERALSEAGLVGSSEQESSDSYEAGKIFKQNPSSGTQVASGSTITYTVSSGKATTTVTVPNVIGLSESSAKQTLEAAGLVVKSTVGSGSASVGEGQVNAQSIASGTSVVSGTTIEITIEPKKSSSSGSSSGSGSGSGSGSSSGSGSGSGSSSGGSSSDND